MGRVVAPLKRGQSREIAESIVAMIDYNSAGEFRRELAQKMIHIQITLAQDGSSTGGRAPFRFRRWLARTDGTPVGALADREYAKMAGHHAVWLPEPAEELTLIRCILDMLVVDLGGLGIRFLARDLAEREGMLLAPVTEYDSVRAATML